MSESELKKFLNLDEILDEFTSDFIQWKSDSFPQNGLIIPKRNKQV
jgi:hypothetical protein